MYFLFVVRFLDKEVAIKMKENKTHSIRYNFIMNFILTASSFIFPLITFPYVSRVLMAEGNGKIAFVSSVANYFLMIASLGIPTYGIRACSQVRNDKEKLSKTAQEIIIINMIVTSLVMITYIALISIIPKFSQDKILFYINGINIVLNVFGVNWLYQALEQYSYITIRSLMFKVISIILMFIFVHKESDYIIYAGIIVFASVGSNILNFINLKKFIILKPMKKYNLKKHIKPILILFAQNLAVSIYTNLDTVMVGFIRDNHEVGLYNAAIKMKSILLGVVTSLANVLLPRMSYYVKNNMMQDFRKMMIKAINFTLMISLPLCTYFIIYSYETILFISGSDYLEAVLAMQFIVFAVIPNGLTVIIGIQILTPLGKEKYVLYSVILGAITNFALNCLLIYKYGASGAAFSTLIAEVIVLIMQLVFSKGLLKNLSDEIFILKYILGIILSTSVVCALSIIEINNVFIKLVITSISFFGTYIIGLFFMREPLINSFANNVSKKFEKSVIKAYD